MADYTQLPLDWQTELEKIGGQSYSLDLVLDPEGRHIVIDGDNSIRRVSCISNKRDIDPQWSGRSVIQDVELEINDISGGLSPLNPNSPFHHAVSILAESRPAGSNELIIHHQQGVDFCSGEQITLVNEDYIYGKVDSEQAVIDSFTPGVEMDSVILTGPVSSNLSVGARVYSQTPENSIVQVRLHLKNTLHPMVVYRGRLLKIPEIGAGCIRLVLADSRKMTLDRTLTGVDSSTDSKLLCIQKDGSIGSSIQCSEDTSGVLDREGVFPKEECRPGKWKQVFENHNQYVMSGPGIDGKQYDKRYGMVGRFAGLENDMGFMWDMVKDLDWLYVPVVETGKLVILDVSDPSDPVKCSSISFADNCIYASIMKKNNYVYIAYVEFSGSYVGGLKCFHVADLNNPVLIDTKIPGQEGVPVDFFSYACKISQRYLYVQGYETLYIFDIDNPFDIQYINSIGGGGAPYYMQGLWQFEIKDNYLFTVSAHDKRLIVLDILSGTAPQLVTTVDLAKGAYNIAIAGDYAFVKCEYGTILVIDISDPANPVIINEYGSSGPPWYSIGNSLAIDSSRLYSASSIHGALSVMDVSGGSVVQIKECIRGTDGPFYLANANFVAASGEYVFIAANDGITIYRLHSELDSVQGGEQLCILPAAWDGYVSVNDWVCFKTTRTWYNENPVFVLYDILRNHAKIPEYLIAASSYFGEICIGTLAEELPGYAGGVTLAIHTPTLLKTGDILSIDGHDFPVTAGNSIQTAYPPEIQVIVNNSYGVDIFAGQSVFLKKRDSLDTEFNFDREYEWCEQNGLHIHLSLDREMSVLQAIECVTAHFNGFLFSNAWGVENIFTHRETSDPVVQVSGDSNLLPGLRINTRSLVNSWQLRYGYDFENNQYGFKTQFDGPVDIHFSSIRYGLQREANLDLPGYFSETAPRFLVGKLYQMWENGVMMIDCAMNLQGITIELGDVLHVQSQHPDIDRYFRVTGKEIDLNDGLLIRLLGYDITHQQGEQE